MINKTCIPVLVLFLIFTSSCAKKSTAVIESTSNKTNTVQQMSPRGADDLGESRFIAMAKEIGLNQTKTSEFIAIGQKYVTERRTMMANRSGDNEAMREKMNAMVSNQNNDIKNILNATQYDKYLSLMQQSRRGRGGAGQRPKRDAPGTGGDPNRQ